MKLIAIVVILFFVPFYNNPPAVKIIAPTSAGTYQWNSSQRYSVSVSDKEDGDTRFDEIPATKILLEARVADDTSKMNVYRKQRSALHAMMASNCMNCHAFKSKLIGPSFADIHKRKGEVSLLVKHIKDGSTGVWGDIVMPSHPELDTEEITQMVNWIMKFGEEKNVEYYTGAEGTFKLQKPAQATANTQVVLIASYTDNDKTAGESIVLLKGKD